MQAEAAREDRCQPETDWAGLGRAFLFFWYFSGVTQVLLYSAGITGFRGLRQSLFVSALWLVPLLLWPARTRGLSAVIGLLLWLGSLPIFGYYLIYGQEFSQSVVFILFESNWTEASEYVGSYFSWSILAALLAYSLGGWLLWRGLRPVRPRLPARILATLFCLGISVAYPAIRQFSVNDDPRVALDKFEARIEPAVPWQLVVGYHQYRRQLDNMQALLDARARIAPLTGLHDQRAGLPTTLVLVIGESTNRRRMGLYGYARPTTPGLEARRDQLDIFGRVISPRPYTIEALEQILTFADQRHPDRYMTTPSLISLMKQAGYRTYWITNQQTMTRRNTLLTSFSEQADEQFYLNNNREQNSSRQYDEVVLEPFRKVLAEPAPRKFIVVHLLGTHRNYKYRYPEDFAVFSGAEGATPGLDASQLEVYNAYDNAVRYNDRVVSELIDRFAETRPDGFLLYLSDHGEAVFDPLYPELQGRSEFSPTADMFAVPFILWRSPAWKARDTLDLSAPVLQRDYSSMDLVHTWSELAGLEYQELDRSRSLVSRSYTPGELLVGDPRRPKALIDFRRLKGATPATPAGVACREPCPPAGAPRL